MGLFQTSKPKSSGKVMLYHGKGLTDLVLDTLNHMSQMVGATLGPGGRAVLIERPEMNMKPIITKDGVTVIKHLGYKDPVKQLILESARDAALRTAAEAGDGTTTATILSAAITNFTQQAVQKNPRISPQAIIREMKALFPYIKKMVYKYKVNVTGDNFEDILLKVATLSANGDVEISKCIIESFNLVGDEGNLTIIEATGPSHYKVERISGYTVDMGYEESCKKFAQGFINDKSGTLVGLNHPLFLLYDGVINDISQVFEGLQRVSEFFDKSATPYRNVVLVSHGFSDTVLGDLHLNWNHEKSSMKVFPLLTPPKAIMNWRTQFLYDLQAYTGSPVFNPIDRPISDIDAEKLYKHNLVTNFECSRFRSSVMSKEDPDLIEARVSELKLQLQNPESEYELNDLQVRIGKLTSGIARLTIFGPSQGETREARDRAEDAWMSIRGTVKEGACPGGGYVLVRLAADLLTKSNRLSGSKKVAALILSQALLEPIDVLYKNYGYHSEQIEDQKVQLLQNDDKVFDILLQEWVPIYELLDSVPAVVEAIDSSISIASLLGTLGGIVSFERDYNTDMYEAKSVSDFTKTIMSDN